MEKGPVRPRHGPTGLDKLALDAKAEDVFIDLLKELTGQGRNVNANKGPTYAPAVFAKEDAASSITMAALEKAMERLLKTSDGAPSKNQSH
jgi:hypothetical protein